MRQVKTLSKSKLLSYLQCPKKLWLEVHSPENAYFDSGQAQAFSVGHEVGEVSRLIYGDGRLISPENNLAEALKITEEEIRSQASHPLYEATFKAGNILIRADVILREKHTIRLVEVKASTSLKPINIQDCAIQNWVLEQAGIKAESVSVAHIDNNFIYQGTGDYLGLLKEKEITEEVEELSPQVPYWVEQGLEILKKPMPNIAVGPHCTSPYDCSFRQYCNPKPAEYPLSTLPHAGKLLDELTEEGYEDLRDVPEERLSKEKHLRIWRSTRTGNPEIDSEAAEIINELSYPRFYLDFETIGFAVPIWKGTRPYEQLPFQWSCHMENRPGEIHHEGFLASGNQAPMRVFLESLISILGKSGPIIVYSAFEAGQLRRLAKRYPDLDDQIQAIIDRLFDLLPIMRKHYYHPDMKGSWSIKKVLPTLAPELQYSNLDGVQDGAQAQTAFAEIIRQETNDERRKQLRESLERYCELDTFAMVKIADALLLKRDS